MRLALFPGSFDPFTCGHLDILERALRIFDEIEVTVAVNSNKVPIFSVEERCALIEASTIHLQRVAVAPFEGLIAEYARKRDASALIRGLRQTNDFEYEQPMALANRHLHPELETVFFLPSSDFTFLSSSIVRDIFRWGGDVSDLVPEPVGAALQTKRSNE
ncbi:MAG: pantetheine-phosphate adenylyltransferase [Rhodothermaceae bacterium]|nr:pantetheine-phosphate adenylyltransferase [Rhodothermaceae bacterium]